MTINRRGLWLRWRGRVIAGAAIVLLLLLWRWQAGRTSEAVGKWREIAVRLQADSARRADEIRRVDSVFTVDTVRLTATRDRFIRRVDSLLVTDTLTVREQVIVQAADTALRACTAVVTSCQARVAARDSLLRVVGEQRDAERRLYEARLRQRDPRLTPYLEALVDPLDESTAYLRAGLTMRFLGPVRLSGALQHATTGPHPTRALVGVRVQF